MTMTMNTAYIRLAGNRLATSLLNAKRENLGIARILSPIGARQPVPFFHAANPLLSSMTVLGSRYTGTAVPTKVESQVASVPMLALPPPEAKEASPTRAVTVPWDEYEGEGGIEDWNLFMKDVGFEQEFPTKTQCWQALDTVWINIEDFLIAMETGQPIHRFESRQALADYTKDLRRWVPKARVPKNSPLRGLCAYIRERESKAQAKAEAQTESKADGNVEGKTAGQTDSVVETKDEVEGKADGKAEARARRMAKSKAKRKAKKDKAKALKAKEQAENKGEVEGKTDDKAEVIARRKAKYKAKCKAKRAKAKALAKEQAENKAEGKTEAKGNGITEGKTKGQVKNEAEIKVQGEAEGKADSEAEGNTKGQSDSKVEVKTKGQVEDQPKGQAEDQSKAADKPKDKAGPEGDAALETEMKDMSLEAK